MRKIHLHGALGKKYGAVFELEVMTAGEAVRALSANLPGFMMDIREGAWHVVRGDDVDNGFDLDEDDIASFKLGRGDLHIVPHVAGSKRGGLLKIILGVALLGAAFAFSGGALATPIMGGALGGATYGNMAMIGVALALAGVSSMLAPEEKDESSKNDSSFTMSGPGNSYEQGSPIPLVYGEVITGGVLVSGGIDVEQIEVED
jgi:predicted phage tail protein